jgi:hypothetical protein
MTTSLRQASRSKKTSAGSSERVFTVTDYWDGPRSGIANYHQKPHHYACIFDEGRDEYSDLYRLTPLRPEAFRAAMEAWKIWNRWDKAFRAGKTDRSTHPALPRDAKRYAELKTVLERALVAGEKRRFTKRGVFKLAGRSSSATLNSLGKFKVAWEEPRIG